MESLPNFFRELSPSYRAADPAGTERWKANEETARNADSVNQPYANRITLEALEAIRIPTLLIAGDADLIAPPPIVRLLSQHIHGSQIAVLPECGHSAYWERPDLFNEAVLKFLRKV
jgi:pimeloyl-ACP methyl ester carboxylesterase